jgi:hypothetical protein
MALFRYPLPPLAMPELPIPGSYKEASTTPPEPRFPSFPLLSRTIAIIVSLEAVAATDLPFPASPTPQRPLE